MGITHLEVSGQNMKEFILMYLNLKLPLQAFAHAPIGSYKHIRVMSDSSSTNVYINKGGIKSKKCNEVAKKICLRCFKNNSFISAAHIPGKHNTETDKFSRKFNNNTEWQFNPQIFIEVTNTFGYPESDLLATRINKQL